MQLWHHLLRDLQSLLKYMVLTEEIKHWLQAITIVEQNQIQVLVEKLAHHFQLMPTNTVMGSRL
jgi:hypothetical protein